MEGDDFISGDYSAATDNIYLEVVQAISEVIASSPYLSTEESEAVLGSFRAENMHWVSSSGLSHAIKRGSMQGNLLSFNMLCLLNKACYNMACSIRRKRDRKLRLELAIINGDDIAFAGDMAFYEDWVLVTSTFGLSVNHEKTGVSKLFIELNSRSFCVLPGGRIRSVRKPVLSCLMVDDDPSCLLSRIIDGLSVLSAGTLNRVIYVLRNDIIRRGVSVSSVPRRFLRSLLKERWFRSALLVKPPIVTEGIERHWQVITRDYAPPECLYPLYDRLSLAFQDEGVLLAKGLKCKPFKSRLKGYPELTSWDPRLGFAPRTWIWRWRAPLLSFWEKLGLPIVFLGKEEWWDDHPDLACKVEVVILPKEYPPPPLWLVDQGVDVSGHLWASDLS
jgi:hypothetical protein